MNFLKNKPFHFILTFIFACIATKTIHASEAEFAQRFSQDESSIILGNNDSLFLEKRNGVWYLMKCDSPDECQKGKTTIRNIASRLGDLEKPLANYCQQGVYQDDNLCVGFQAGHDLLQRIKKGDRDITGGIAVVGLVALKLGLLVVHDVALLIVVLGNRADSQ